MLCDTNGMWVEDEFQLQSMENSFYKNIFINIDREDAWFQTPISYHRVFQESLNMLSVDVNDTGVIHKDFYIRAFQTHMDWMDILLVFIKKKGSHWIRYL